MRRLKPRKSYKQYERTEQQSRRLNQYRPILENLAALLVNPKGYISGARSFLSDQYQWRLSRAFSGTLFLVAAVFLLFISIFLLVMAAYFFLDEQLKRPALSALILGWVLILIFFLVSWLSIKRYKDVAGPRR
ncbi:MAG: phage holin family protein [Leptonema sp. (in: Bacteria)]|nr:phage holin family protein [Leptonema sp. (in: bacteria)]